ncbi:flagellar basal body rod protein FlgB [Neobacillus terrae]|uniref:flagellar basal body rod protein FlgB n=1 Tax=Neobacillus terrae TaxID=3034837 RepID=UPI00140D35B1|nr:flagellar basal body rod protein FlgB [Neobacillus terrae]NHM29788.1 flagellar basal body rod protein FlgB [Neobacillus terrae]
MDLFSNMSTIERALNYSSLKQKVISKNIANVDTPNYKAEDVSFKSILNNELDNSFKTYRTDSRHFDFSDSSSNSGEIITKKNVQYNSNGNSVDMDKEMSDLATNQIYYNALIERLNGKFSTLQNVIRGGK